MFEYFSLPKKLICILSHTYSEKLLYVFSFKKEIVNKNIEDYWEPMILNDPLFFPK